MKQQCNLSLIYLNWIVYLGGLGYLLWAGKYTVAAFWLLLVPLLAWVYLRLFPKLSVFLGYGKVDDKRTQGASYAPTKAKVRFYVALGCPFCPVVERRLKALQQKMGFELEKIDVTYRPELLARKGIRAVPVVEADDRRLVGHATTDQLAALIVGGEKAT
jgi:glutaredoxin